MKNKTLNGQGTVNVTLVDTQTGDELNYNPESQLLESDNKDNKEEIEICSVCEKEFPLKDMHAINNSDKFLCPTCYDKSFDSSPFEVDESYDEADFEDPVICSWCKDMFEKADCKKEKDMGWLCDQCQRALESRGVELTFEEATIEEMGDDSIEVKDDKVITKIDDDTTIEKDFDSSLQAQVATAAVKQGKADPKVLVPEASEIEEDFSSFNAMHNDDGSTTYSCDGTATYDYKTGEFGCEEDTQTEKLYSNPSEPSDGYEKEPLEDATTDDFIVTLKDIDWNIDHVDPNFLSKIEQLPDTIDVRVQGTTIDTADSPEDLKAAILSGANETMNPFGINDGVVVSIKDAKTGEELA